MLQYRRCEASDGEALTALLYRLDATFPIPLSRKTDLSVYGAKLLAQGAVCGAWENGDPVGLCGFYANDLQTKKAYVAVLGVLETHQRRGIARRLLQDSLALCRQAGMQECCLFTHQTNLGAIALYRSFGFAASVTPERPEDILFTKEL